MIRRQKLIKYENKQATRTFNLLAQWIINVKCARVAKSAPDNQFRHKIHHTGSSRVFTRYLWIFITLNMQENDERDIKRLKERYYATPSPSIVCWHISWIGARTWLISAWPYRSNFKLISFSRTKRRGPAVTLYYSNKLSPMTPELQQGATAILAILRSLAMIKTKLNVIWKQQSKRSSEQLAHVCSHLLSI